MRTWKGDAIVRRECEAGAGNHRAPFARGNRRALFSRRPLSPRGRNVSRPRSVDVAPCSAPLAPNTIVKSSMVFASAGSRSVASKASATPSSVSRSPCSSSRSMFRKPSAISLKRCAAFRPSRSAFSSSRSFGTATTSSAAVTDSTTAGRAFSPACCSSSSCFTSIR